MQHITADGLARNDRMVILNAAKQSPTSKDVRKLLENGYKLHVILFDLTVRPDLYTTQPARRSRATLSPKSGVEDSAQSGNNC